MQSCLTTFQEVSEITGAPSISHASIPTINTSYATQLEDVPEFGPYGPYLGSTLALLQLSERKPEYKVTCIKHIFGQNICYQYDVLPNTVIKAVTVRMQETVFAIDSDFLLASIVFASPQTIYISFSCTDIDSSLFASFYCKISLTTANGPHPP
ncbi:coatomer gamma subunit appendage platform subdomain-containing protein [Rhodocollybia butyracea]|uniref:Coatomer gamma subunit appendage platform subdomain-containing protein n=1 Tax=Rhodocollybia butyracea TaxID=206335 RepID=A0A9P5TXJ9_9AGAR|nr:coatomer gamma subunit appendage platform subdomain-containing protein [Rhodocollybia butyracea]